MRDWEKIKHIRTDMSDYVLHCTRQGYIDIEGKRVLVEPFAVLQNILRDGFFKATFAIREKQKSGRIEPTIKGPNPSVCFTEQPLRFFLESVSANRRYTEFAIAVRKDDLYSYGGRPVIYSDEFTLYQLPDDLKYLWVLYRPTALWQSDRHYPIDWTHEREWRVCPNLTTNQNVGLSDTDSAGQVVPIHLPSKNGLCPKTPNFAILVDTEQRKKLLMEWIEELSFSRNQRNPNEGYWSIYPDVLSRCKNRIISFEIVKEQHSILGRVEDFLPK